MSTTTTIQYAPLWRRFAAIVYDTLLVTAVSMGYGAVGVALTHSLSGGDAVETSNHFHWAFQFGWLFVVIAFFCFFWARVGQTLGMRAWRLKIVKENTQHPPSLSQCIQRCFLAPFCLPLFFLGWLRNDQQCLHDLATGTQVVLLPKGS